MESHRTYLLYTLLVLRKYSSMHRPLTMKDISAYVAKEFNKTLDRRTLAEHIKILKSLQLYSETSDHPIFPYEIIEQQRTYYLQGELEESEVKLLCDAIAFSRFIHRDHSLDLIRKLHQIVGRDDAHRYEARLDFKDTSAKDYNPSLFFNVELVAEAIDRGVGIEFDYLKFNLKKELVPYNGKSSDRRKVYPYYLIWTLNRYYVMCRYENYEKDYFLRLDKMKEITLTSDPTPPLPDTFDLHQYTRNQVFMFGGEAERIRFRCRMGILGPVIDFFGEDVQIDPVDEEHFRVTLETSQQSIFYWLMQYSASVDEIEPEPLRQRFVSTLQDALVRNATADELQS